MDKVTGIKVLRQALTMQGISRSSIGRDLGIDASQVSRIAAGRFVKLDGHALRVCKYAQALVTGAGATDPQRASSLEARIADLVAFNPVAAKALAELVEALMGQALESPSRPS
ncbi:MAG: hypothetical protein ABS932_02515 [Stenotrophomonas sp.]|uniref:hypothetical protein n=1 Tax=Stenotrophomonas sp. TaxID=69392 RepID=UPI00331611BD